MTRIVEAIVSSDARKPRSVYTFYGSNTESKPTTADVADGSVWVNTDDGTVYMYDESATTWRIW